MVRWHGPVVDGYDFCSILIAHVQPHIFRMPTFKAADGSVDNRVRQLSSHLVMPERLSGCLVEMLVGSGEGL